jgi:hypothetical protein
MSRGANSRDRQGSSHFFLQFHKPFPDIHVEVADTISRETKSLPGAFVTGTHKGDALGHSRVTQAH